MSNQQQHDFGQLTRQQVRERDSFPVEKLDYCARCGGAHVNLVFKKLMHSIITDEDHAPFTHWAPCPVNGDLIIVSINNARGEG